MSSKLLKQDGAKSNFAFQVLYKTLVLVVPLIVSPYLTRTLGSTSLGVYTYTYSIAYYFVIIAMLGIDKHGRRIIALRRYDRVVLRKTFWSLYLIHFIASVFMLAAYLVYVLLICKSDVDVALIQAIYVFSAALDITWLFYGLEKARFVAIRNAIVKLVETVCIFCFVHDPSDVLIYTIIMCVSTCLGHVVVMPQVLAVLPPIHVTKEDMWEHIKPLLTLFLAVIAVSLYTVFDKTLLGLLSTKDNVAFYEYSDKIVRVPITFIAMIGTVLFPRSCRYAEENNFGKLSENFSICLTVASFIGFTASFGIASVADSFAVLYYGEDFAVCGSVMVSMCPLILVIGLGDAVRSCYIYPLKHDSTMVKIVTINAVVNLILSALLIPVLGIYGAVIGTVSAELTGFCLQIWLYRKYVSVKDYVTAALPFLVIGVIMYAGVKLVAHYIDGSIVALIVQVAVGAVIYCGLSFVYGYFMNDTTKGMLQSVFSALKKRIRRAG